MTIAEDLAAVERVAAMVEKTQPIWGGQLRRVAEAAKRSEPEHGEGKVERLRIAVIDLSAALADAEERHDLNLPPSVDSAWAWLTACIQEMEASSHATVGPAK